MSANVIGYSGASSPSTPAAQPSDGVPVLTGGGGLAPLVWRGSILTVVTLGIYRFWYKTDLRRWYWRHTSAAGSGFEYRGTAKELLLGFLFALAILVPLYAGVAIGALFAGEIIGAGLNFAFALLFLLLVQYGAYRSRRYRLTRTFWRGLRFDQKGSAWRYAAMSFGWTLLTMLTLGLLYPLMSRSLERYKIRNTRFGSAEGRFEAPIGQLMRTWLLVLGPLLVAIVLGILAGVASLQNGRAAAGVGIAAAVFAGLAFLWAPLLWPLYRIREFRIFADGTSIGPVAFRSGAGAKAAYGIYAKFLLVASVVTSALGVLAAAAVDAAGGPQLALTGARSSVVIGAFAVIYLAGFLVLGVLKELLLNQPFWRLTVGTLTAYGLDQLDEIVNLAVREEAATGEGFADALDFGGV